MADQLFTFAQISALTSENVANSNRSAPVDELYVSADCQSESKPILTVPGLKHVRTQSRVADTNKGGKSTLSQNSVPSTAVNSAHLQSGTDSKDSNSSQLHSALSSGTPPTSKQARKSALKTGVRRHGYQVELSDATCGIACGTTP
jgi:hypothetical protein